MESTRSTTDTLVVDIRRAINRLPLAHRSEPLNGELVDMVMQTKDSCKTEGKEQKRAWTAAQAPRLPILDVDQLCRRVGHDKARELAKGLRAEVSYKKAQRIHKNHDLTIERKEFYNLMRKEATKTLKAQEELTLLLACLDQEDFCVRIHKREGG